MERNCRAALFEWRGPGSYLQARMLDVFFKPWYYADEGWTIEKEEKRFADSQDPDSDSSSEEFLPSNSPFCLYKKAAEDNRPVYQWDDHNHFLYHSVDEKSVFFHTMPYVVGCSMLSVVLQRFHIVPGKRKAHVQENPNRSLDAET